MEAEDEREIAANDAAEDEEEVELFSASRPASESAPPPSPSLTLSSSLSEKLLLSPRRCVSKELLDQMPTLSTNTRYHEVSVPAPFGCFHLMQLIEKSIQVGALFSPKLYVPKEIWQQDRVKLAGVALKMEVFQQFKQALEKTSMHLPLTTDAGKAAFQKDLDALLESARQERIQLERAFPFLHADAKSAQQSSPSASVSSASDQAADADASALPAAAALAAQGVGKLTNLAFGFGRMVKKQAIAAVERVGAVQPTAIPLSELEEYAAVLCMFFNSTRNIELLLGLSADADGTQQQVNELLTTTENPQLDEESLKRLRELAIFLDEVVVELVMRDVHLLLEAYLRRVTRSFGEFSVEQSLMKRNPPVSA